MKKEFRIFLKYFVLLLVPALMLSASIIGQSLTEEDLTDTFEKDEANLIKLSNWDGFYGMPECMAYKENYAYIGGFMYGLVVAYVPFFGVPNIVEDYYFPEGEGDSTTDLAVSDIDNYIYMATRYDGLIVFHFDNTTNTLSRVGEYKAFTGFVSVKLIDDICYLSSTNDRLVALNISDPTTPTYIGEYNVGVEIRDSFINNDLVYLACWNNGIHVLNVSDPTSITFHTSIVMTEVKGLVADNELIFIATNNFKIYNQTDSTTINYSTISDPYNIIIQGTVAFISEGSEVELVDISNVASPQYISSFSSNEVGQIKEVHIDRNFLFYTDDYRAFEIYDIFDPYNPKFSVSLPLHAYESDVLIDGTTAYIAAANFSLVALNIVNPANPVPIAYYDSPIGGEKILSANDYLFLMGLSGGVEILNPQLPVNLVGSYNLTGSNYDISIHGNRMYLATTNGFEIVDISNPTNPVKIGENTSPSSSHGIIANSNDTIYTFTMDTVYTWDVTDPESISMLDSHTLSGNIADFYCIGNQLVSVGQTLTVFDVSVPTSIEVIGSRAFTNSLGSVTMINNIVVLLEIAVGVHLVNLTDLTNLPIIDTINENDSYIPSLHISEDYLCFAKFEDGVDFYSYDVEQIIVVDPEPTTTPPPGSTPRNLILWLGVGISSGVIAVVIPLSIIIGRKRMLAKREIMKRDAAISQLTSCYYCGFLIKKDAITCEDCGKDVIRCVVCKLPVSLGDTLGQCSLCEANAHYEHMLDWVKKSGKCPHCQQKVPEDSVVIISSEAVPKKKKIDDLED